MTKIELAGTTYMTQKAAREAIQHLLRNRPKYTPLNGQDDQFFRDLINRHPEAAKKIGVGIKQIEIRSNGKHPGLSIIRIDGTSTDLSYQRCIRSTPASPQSEIHAAFRKVIKPDLLEFRRDYFDRTANPVCAITGAPITNSHLTHVDHKEPTFEQLADAFIANWPHPIMTAADDGEAGRHLIDPDVEEAWRIYHSAHAELRLTTASANLTRSKDNDK